MRPIFSLILSVFVLLGCAATPTVTPTPTVIAGEFDAYAQFLRDAGQTDRASEVAEQAQTMRRSEQARREAYQAMQAGRPYDTSFYMGFDPYETLREYSGALRNLGRGAEADEIDAMANAWREEQLANARAGAALSQ